MGQPGSWIYQILGHIEQDSLSRIGSGIALPADRMAALTELCKSPVGLFHCPSRRSGEALPYTENMFLPYNCVVSELTAKTDYAINAGHEIVDGKAGPATMADFDAYAWPDLTKATGIAFSKMSIRQKDIRDGLSNTLLVGEKYLPRGSYSECKSLGDDQSMYIGDDADNRRWAYESPKPDAEADDIQGFGSAHRGGALFVFCDGSARVIEFDIDALLFQNLGNRSDGQVVVLE